MILPPHFRGSKQNASRARFWHKDSAMSMYLKIAKIPSIHFHKHHHQIQGNTESEKEWCFILISSIVSCTRIPFAVFVCHDRPHSLHHRERGKILWRDEFQSLWQTPDKLPISEWHNNLKVHLDAPKNSQMESSLMTGANTNLQQEKGIKLTYNILWFLIATVHSPHPTKPIHSQY